MVTFTTPSIVRTTIGFLLTFEDGELTVSGDDLIVADSTGDTTVSVVRAAADLNIVCRQDGSIMSINKRFGTPWHTGETASPFAITVRHYDGTVRSDIVSATFTLVNRADSTKLIDAEDCQLVSAGVLSYRPIAEQMDTACLFLAQYTATLDTGYVLPTIFIEGEIEESL